MIEFSLLCLERFKLENKLAEILPYIDSLHLDIMDGKFVPNTAFTPEQINDMQYKKAKHIHIMAFNPEKIVPKLVSVQSISFHLESTDKHEEIIDLIKSNGCQAGICINPETPVDRVKHLLDRLDRIIIMAVKPGFSGQKYIPSTSKKITALRKLSKSIEVVIDGGMHEDTIREVMTLGANACVVCTVIIKAPSYKNKIRELKESGLIGCDNWVEISDRYYAPFKSKIDIQNGAIQQNSSYWVRRLSDMKNIYSDKKQIECILKHNDPIIYEVWQQNIPFESGHLIAVTTRLYPGMIGNEFFMTKGHYHAKPNTAEVYLCLRGKGILLLQLKEGICKSIEMKKGIISYIPPYWAHRVVNTGNIPLIIYGVYPADAGHDYVSIEKSGFKQSVIKKGKDVVVV